MTNLRDELQRLADTHESRPQRGLWQEGRRLRTYDRVRIATLVVAVIVVLTAATTWTLRPTEVGPADSADPAVEAIPRSIEQITGEAATDPTTIGRASAAYVNSDGDPVVLTAADGRAHVLDLESWDRGESELALSPNGRRLAWSTGDLGSGAEAVGVVQLVAGRVAQHPIAAGSSHTVDGLSWSPSSSTLAWWGELDGRSVVAAESEPVTVRAVRQESITGVAVANNGDMTVTSGQVVVTVSDHKQVVHTVDNPGWSAAAMSPDGSQVAVAVSGTSSATLDIADNEVVRHRFPEGTFPRADIRPLGWVDDRLQLLLVDDGDRPELVITTPEVDETSTWRRSVGYVDPGIADSLTLAVDLIPDWDGTSSQEFTHDFDTGFTAPLPIWLLILLCLVPLAVAIAVIRLLARR